MRPPALLLALALAGCAARVQPPAEQRVTFPTVEGTGQGKLWAPAAPGPHAAVVVLHGDHGLTERIERHAQRLRDAGYVVFAVDLYRGEKIGSLLDAHIMDRGLPEERARADLKGAVDHLVARPDVRKDAVGVIGWDMGGGYALDAALADPRLRAVATCYGRLTTDPALLAKLNGPVLAVMAGKDEGNPPEARDAFREAMRKAGKKLTLEVFQECDHGFMNPAGESKPAAADERAAEEAWKRIEAFFAAELRQR
jgi:carboxymethylenebutenolidase